MSVIKVEDVAYVRFAAPDLEAMRAFLLEFGLLPAQDGPPGRLCMRGYGPSPVLHVTEPAAEPGFRGLALRAASRADLERLARSEGADVEPLDLPGGGDVVRLVDPNGFRVEVVAGQAPAAARRGASNPGWNVGARRERTGLAKRVPAGPSHVLRLGHVVLLVDDVDTTWRWWRDRFGLLISDEVRAADGRVAGMFVRCDRGATPADHHTLNFAAAPAAGFHHAAFEVEDLDDLMAGHARLTSAGRRHVWGVGRHVLGSQVFDYWMDPFGHRVEHWTDGDLFDAGEPARGNDLDVMLGLQWGPAAPPDFA